MKLEAVADRFAAGLIRLTGDPSLVTPEVLLIREVRPDVEVASPTCGWEGWIFRSQPYLDYRDGCLFTPMPKSRPFGDGCNFYAAKEGRRTDVASGRLRAPPWEFDAIAAECASWADYVERCSPLVPELPSDSWELFREIGAVEGDFLLRKTPARGKLTSHGLIRWDSSRRPWRWSLTSYGRRVYSAL